MDVSLHNPPFVKDEDEGIPTPQITSSPFDLPFYWPGSIGYQWAPLIFEQRPESATLSLLENLCGYAVSKCALSSPAVQPGSGPTAPTLALTIAAVHSSVPSWGTFPPGKQEQTQKFCFFFFECCKPYVRQKGGEMTAERARHRGSHPPPLQLSRKHPVRNAFCTGTFLEIINCKRWRLVLLGACDSSWVFRDVLARRVRWSELIRWKAPCHRVSSLKSIRAAPSSGKRYFSCNKNLFPLFICFFKKTLFFSFLIFLLLFFSVFLFVFPFFLFFKLKNSSFPDVSARHRAVPVQCWLTKGHTSPKHSEHGSPASTMSHPIPAWRTASGPSASSHCLLLISSFWLQK